MQQKICKHCQTTDNLRTNKNGVVYNCCWDCYTRIEIPQRMEQTKKALAKKYGVDSLGQLSKERARCRAPKPEKKVVCKYCGSGDIIIKDTGKRLIKFATCQLHWKQYQKDKDKKRRETNLKKFGKEYAILTNKAKNKFKQTMQSKYGCDYPMQDRKIIEKRNKTNIERYGSICPTNNNTINKKREETNLKKFGVRNPLMDSCIRNKVTYTARKNYWEKLQKLLQIKKIAPCFNIEQYATATGLLTYKCLRCNKIFKSMGTEPQHIWCGCTKRKSSYEYEIEEWLQQEGIADIKPNEKFRENGRIRFEIDTYLPEYNLGIDFHGLYWHSSEILRNSYHKEKYEYFKKMGIQLIQVFENEWLNKKDIVKSIIKNRLNMNTTIPARKCSIRECTYHETKSFLEINHLQGHATAPMSIGLFYDSDLICLGSFGKSRFKNEDAVELIRFCSKCGINIIGGFQKILKYFESTYKPENIISFIDLRYFNGNGYTKSGFKKVHTTSPNYYYFRNNEFKLYNRMRFQKHKLKNQLNIFDPLLSEYDNMHNNGYFRIYDAGNLKMKKNY